MAEPLSVSKLNAHERRSAFAARAPALAMTAGLPTIPYKKEPFPLPAWASFYADDHTLAVLVCPGEHWQTVERALAYGVAHAQGRNLGLVLPEHRQGQHRDPLQATLIRAAFLAPDIRLWTHDGEAAKHRGPLEITAARALLWQPALNGGELDLKDLAARVADLESWADTHLDLDACHEKSHRTWRCQGLILLSIQRKGKGLLIKSGVHYSKPTPNTPLPDSLELVDRNLTPAELSKIKERVHAAVTAKHAGLPTGYREHWMQATLARHPTSIGWSGRHQLEREFPAKRPGGGTGYIDFLRLDDCGTLHITETKIGHDEMLVLQGLDYWIWAQANATLLADHFEVPAIDHVVIDYVVGPDDGKHASAQQQAALSPYTPAQLEALAKEVDWQVHLCAGWSTSTPVMDSLGPRTVPGPPHVHHRT